MTSARILEPAMSVLAANMEADAMSMFLDVYNNVNNVGSAITFAKLLGGRKVLNDNLAPIDNNRSALLNTQDNVDLIDALKGLFRDSAAITKQYKEGMMGRTAGFDFYENTLIPTQTTGTAASATTYTVNGASQTGSTVTVATGATTFKKGDIVTFAGCNRCHPETKADTGRCNRSLSPLITQAALAISASARRLLPAAVGRTLPHRQPTEAQ